MTSTADEALFRERLRNPFLGRSCKLTEVVEDAGEPVEEPRHLALLALSNANAPPGSQGRLATAISGDRTKVNNGANVDRQRKRCWQSDDQLA